MLPVGTMLEQDIATVLANATSAINKEADMNEGRTPTPRPPTTHHTDTIQDTTEQALARLSDELEFARQEEKYWIASRQNIENAMEALHAALNVLTRDQSHAGTAKTSK